MTTLNGMLDAATRNAGTGNDIAIAAGEVIARRVILGMAAAFDPVRADHAEFARMVPEKMEAFSAAGMIMLEQSNQFGWECSRIAADEVMTTARATLALTGCTTPMAMAEAQGHFALAWFNRAATNLFAMGMLVLGAQQAAMIPIQQAVADNTVRLST